MEMMGCTCRSVRETDFAKFFAKPAPFLTLIAPSGSSEVNRAASEKRALAVSAVANRAIALGGEKAGDGIRTRVAPSPDGPRPERGRDCGRHAQARVGVHQGNAANKRRAGDGIRTRDVHLGKVAFYH
jgi:hypothetical protein